MFLSGPINRYIENTTKKSLLSTIWILVFVNVYLGWIRDVDFVTDGYNLLNFVMLYLIGRYLRLHHSWRLSKKIDVFIYLGSSVITAVLAFALHHFGGDPYRAFCYNSPMVLVSAIAIFMFFTKLHFNSNVINYIASSCLAIYLMQEGGIHCYNQIKEIYIQSGINVFFVIAILVLFILSMIIPLLVDKIRLLVFGKFEKFLTDKLESLVFKRWIE